MRGDETVEDRQAIFCNAKPWHGLGASWHTSRAVSVPKRRDPCGSSWPELDSACCVAFSSETIPVAPCPHRDPSASTTGTPHCTTNRGYLCRITPNGIVQLDGLSRLGVRARDRQERLPSLFASIAKEQGQNKDSEGPPVDPTCFPSANILNQSRLCVCWVSFSSCNFKQTT